MYRPIICIWLFGATTISIRNREYEALSFYFEGFDKIPPNVNGTYGGEGEMLLHVGDSVYFECSARYPIAWLGLSSNDPRPNNSSSVEREPLTKAFMDTIYMSSIHIINLTLTRTFTCAKDHPSSTLSTSIRINISRIERQKDAPLQFVHCSISPVTANQPKWLLWVHTVCDPAFKKDLLVKWHHRFMSSIESLTGEYIQQSSPSRTIPWSEIILPNNFTHMKPVPHYLNATQTGNYTVVIMDTAETEYLSKTFEIIIIKAVEIRAPGVKIFPLNDENEISTLAGNISQVTRRHEVYPKTNMLANGSYFGACVFRGNPILPERAFMYHKKLHCPPVAFSGDDGDLVSLEAHGYIPYLQDGAFSRGQNCTDFPTSTSLISVLHTRTATDHLILSAVVTPGTEPDHYGCLYNLTGDRDRAPLYLIDFEMIRFREKFVPFFFEMEYLYVGMAARIVDLPPDEIILGDNVTLRCASRNDKHPFLYWRIGNRYVTNYDDPGPGYRIYTTITSISQIFDLIISKINESMTYVCHTNTFVSSEDVIHYGSEVDVRVNVPKLPYLGPNTTDHNTTVKATVGPGVLTVTCDAHGSPKPRIEWFNVLTSISNDRGKMKNVTDWSERTGNLSTLRVPRDISNTGVYKCVIRNRVGDAQRQFRISITSPLSGGYIAAVVVSVVATGAVLAGVITVYYRTIQKKRRLKELHQELRRQAKEPGAEENLNQTIPVNEQVHALSFDFRYEIPQNAFEITSEHVGHGAFGKVTVAYLMLDDGQKFKVAAKSPRNGMDVEQQKGLSDELKMMMYIGPHVNVLSLLAMHVSSMERGVSYAFTEFCQFNSLQDYLQKNAPSTSKLKDGYKRALTGNQTISGLDLLSYSYQVANGMAYLTSKNVVHRDLALRNVLLTGRSVVKIADFGLARPIGQNKTITDEGRVHATWQPVESIRMGQYTEKSDVWSFGVVLWEIFTFGDSPYKKLYAELAEQLQVSSDDFSQLQSRFLASLEGGSRMEQPAQCPDDIFELMGECWRAERDTRPSFSICQEKIKIAIRIRSEDYWGKLENLLASMTHVWVVPQYYNISQAVALKRE